MGSGIGNTELRTQTDINSVFIMSFGRSNTGSVGTAQNVNSMRSPGFLASSLSKSAADKMMWSLWTMGEDDESQEETDFNLKEQQEKKGGPGLSMVSSLKGHTEGERRGSRAESSSWGTGRAPIEGRGSTEEKQRNYIQFGLLNLLDK